MGEGGRRKKRGREIEIRGERTGKEKKRQRRRRKDRGKERENGKRKERENEKAEKRKKEKEKGRRENKGKREKAKGKRQKEEQGQDAKEKRKRQGQGDFCVGKAPTCAVISAPAPTPSVKWPEQPLPVSPKLGLRKGKRWGRSSPAGPRGRRWAPAAPRNGLRITFVFLVILLKVTPHLQIA